MREVLRTEPLAKQPHPKDVEVGTRIRLVRKTQGLSQTALGDLVGLSFQQIQKYESGANRVGSGRLSDIAKALGVNSSDLLVDDAQNDSGEVTANQEMLDDMMSSQGIELCMAFFAIKDPKIRASLLASIQNISGFLEKAEKK